MSQTAALVLYALYLVFVLSSSGDFPLTCKSLLTFYFSHSFCSHSIFSIRILRIEDIATPRVHTVSE